MDRAVAASRRRCRSARVFLVLRVALPVAERGARPRRASFFCRSPIWRCCSRLRCWPTPGADDPHHHDWLRVLSLPAVLVGVGDRVGAGALRPGPGATRGAAHHARPDSRRGLPGTAALVLTRSQVDVTKVFTASVLDRGHRPRAAGDAGQRHGRPGAAARARLRHRRLDQDRRQDHRPHPRGPLARHDAGDQERRPHHRAQRHGRARRAHQLQPAGYGAPSVGLHPRALPPSAGAGARAGRGRVRSVPGVRDDPPPDCMLWEFKDDAGRVRVPLLDRRLQPRRPIGQRGAQHHLVRAPPRRHGDPVPVAEREHDRDERGPRGAQATTRSTRAASMRCRGSTCSARSTPRRSIAWRAACAWRSSARAR